jgi:hypothetical protein
MFTQSDPQRKIFYYAAPEDLYWIEMIDQSFEDLKQQCCLIRGSLEDFSLLGEMGPEKRAVALESLKRQRRLIYGSHSDISLEEIQAEEEHLASYEKGVSLLVILVSKHVRKTGLLADPLSIHEMVMRRWRGTGVVVGLLLEPVDEHIWPGQMGEFSRQTPLLGQKRPLSAWENLNQGLYEISQELFYRTQRKVNFRSRVCKRLQTQQEVSNRG